MKFHWPRGEESTVKLIIAYWSEENHERQDMNTNRVLLLCCAVMTQGLRSIILGLTKKILFRLSPRIVRMSV